jgi:hypothetical protein
MLQARLEQSTRGGELRIDTRIFDVRDVELALAQVIDDKPVLLVTFNTQQVTVSRDLKTGKVAEGKEVRRGGGRGGGRMCLCARMLTHGCLDVYNMLPRTTSRMCFM